MNTKAKNPSRFETVLSFGILSVLVLTAGVILVRQSHFNPAVLQLAADQVISGSPAATPGLPDSGCAGSAAPKRIGSDGLGNLRTGHAVG